MIAHTGNRSLRLWRETLELLGHDTHGLRRAAVGARDKYFLPPQARDVAATYPLKALVWIDRTPTVDERFTRLTGIQRAMTISIALYRNDLAKEYNRRGASALGDLRLPGVDVYLVQRPRDLTRLERHADEIEALAARSTG